LAARGFDWDEANRPKCEKHGVSPADIEAMFDSPLAIFSDLAHSRDEERFIAIGKNRVGQHPALFTRRKRNREMFFGRLAPDICTRRKSNTMKKKLPEIRSDEQAEEFVAKADLTDYDLSRMRLVRFEFQLKSERVNMRLPRSLLEAVKASAAKAGVPYQRFIRQVLEAAVHHRE
jgi:predicted DNA binding CopG/RHH family protein/uncharacterized DUF497 family protein